MGVSALGSGSWTRSTILPPSRFARRLPTTVLPVPMKPVRMMFMCQTPDTRHQTSEALKLSLIACIIARELAQGIAAELLEEGAGELEGDHRLPDHAGRGHGRDVRALDGGDDGPLRVGLDGAERLAQGGGRLQGPAHDLGLAGVYPALEP